VLVNFSVKNVSCSPMVLSSMQLQKVSVTLWFRRHQCLVLRDAGTAVGQRGQWKRWGQWKLMKTKKSSLTVLATVQQQCWPQK